MKKQILAIAGTVMMFASFLGSAHASPSATAQENLKKLIATRSCPGCDLSGLNFNRMDLSSTNLEGADLSMSTFFLTNLSYANLKKATMNGAVFGGADLGDADLTGADLRGVSLDSAYLGGTKMTGELITTKPFEKIGVDEVERDVYVENQAISKKVPKQKDVNVSEGKKISETLPVIVATKVKQEVVQQENAEKDVEEVVESSPPVTVVPTAPLVKKPSIVQKVTVPVEVNEEVQTEESIPAEEIALSSASKKDMSKSQESVAVKTKSVPQFNQPIIKESAVIDNDKRINLEQLTETKSCYGCNLSDVNLSGENLKNADLEKANLSGANLEKADLRGANLKGAILVSTNFKKANLKNADLYKANLTGADLSGANQENVSFDDALVDDAVGVERSLILLPGK